MLLRGGEGLGSTGGALTLPLEEMKDLGFKEWERKQKHAGHFLFRRGRGLVWPWPWHALPGSSSGAGD